MGTLKAECQMLNPMHDTSAGKYRGGGGGSCRPGLFRGLFSVKNASELILPFSFSAMIPPLEKLADNPSKSIVVASFSV